MTAKLVMVRKELRKQENHLEFYLKVLTVNEPLSWRDSLFLLQNNQCYLEMLCVAFVFYITLLKVTNFLKFVYLFLLFLICMQYVTSLL